jgi:hypothetical protein
MLLIFTSSSVNITGLVSSFTTVCLHHQLHHHHCIAIWCFTGQFEVCIYNANGKEIFLALCHCIGMLLQYTVCTVQCTRSVQCTVCIVQCTRSVQYTVCILLFDEFLYSSALSFSLANAFAVHLNFIFL